MPLPIVEGSEQLSTPASTVKLDVGPLREAALAPGRLAAAIGQDVGGLFQDVSDNIQKARNNRKVYEAERAMITTKDQFLSDIQKDPSLASDTGKWVPAYQQRVEALQDKILSQSDLAPVVKRELTARIGIWGAASTAEIRMGALKKEASDIYDSGMTTATHYLQNGYVDDAVKVYQSLGESGLMGPKEIAARTRQAPEIANEAKANVILTTAGDQAERVMKEQMEGKLEPHRFKVAMKQAEEVTRHAQAENAEGLAGRMDDDKEHQLPKEAKAWRDAGKITSAQYEHLQARVEHYMAQERRDERNDYNVAIMEAGKPPTDAVGLEKWSHDMKERGLEWTNPALRKDLNQYVDRQVESVRTKGRVAERPVLAAQFKDDEKDREMGLFAPWGRNAEGDPVKLETLNELRKVKDSDIKPLLGEGSSRQSMLDEEASNWAYYREQMMDYEKKNPESSPDDLLKESQRLKKPFIVRDVIRLMNITARKDQYREGQTGKTKDGKPVIYKNGEWVDAP